MGYLPGLDGIRAIAIIGVLLYHADLPFMPGGFLGVDVFFVLSGFLITSLILEEFDRSGRIDFGKFYLGRARRLLPALVLVLLVTAIAAAFVYRDAARQVAADVLASVFYVNNWWYVLADQSYFEAIGRPPLLKHLWSLSVEEQFYLIWPAVAFLVVKGARRVGLAVVALVLAIASTAWMAVLSVANGYPDYADPSRAYFGTDSHAMGLLIGAALASAWRPGRLASKVPRGGAVILTTIGLAALAGVIWFLAFVGEFTPWLYRGGFLAIAVVTAILIAIATHPAIRFGAVLGIRPMRYIGQRSYGLYLWHWPVFMVTRPGLDIALDGLPLLALRLALTFGIAELSFRFVEMPIRRGAIDRFVKRRREADGRQRRSLAIRTWLIGATAMVAVIFLGAQLMSAPRQSEQSALPADVAEAIGIASGGPTAVSLEDPVPSAAPTSSATGSPMASSSASPAGSGQPSAAASGPSDDAEPTAIATPGALTPNGRVSAIGDSVMLGARQALKETIPGTRVDAEVSRMPGAFIGPLKRYVARGKLAPIVVLHPATNGVLPEDMFREMLTILKDVPRVVVVNSHMPRSWRDANNAVINKVLPEFGNAVLADWEGASDGKDDYFVSDGIHLTQSGAKAFAEIIKRATGI
jgi:peptidoglycan/LPS O-acetylase OafA/YrhL